MHCPRCGATIADDQFACSQCGYLEEFAVNATSKAAKLLKDDSGFSYAGFWRRSAALLVDHLILLISAVFLAAIIGGLILGMSAMGGHRVSFRVIRSFALGFGAVYVVGVNWAYFTGFESSKYWGTLGKIIMGLQVADLEGKAISLGQANIRYWGKLLSALVLFGGFWMVGFTPKKRALHDLLAGTVVLKREKPRVENKPEQGIKD